MDIDLKSEFLKLLDKDIEFRYAVAGYLGISEILKKIDAFIEEQRKLWESQNKLREDLNKLIESQNKLWESNNKLWESQNQLREDFNRLIENQNKLWESQNKLWESHNRLWESNNKLREDLNKLIESQNKLWENQNKLWESSNKLWEEVKNLRKDFLRLDRNIRALGARWGVMAESAFRNSLKGLLEKSFNIKVERWTSYDNEGLVYGYPSDVEVDVAIRDQELILIEVTSHAKKSDVSLFNRKAIFYEKKVGKKPSRLLLVTPYADDDAQELAKKLKIELYTNI